MFGEILEPSENFSVSTPNNIQGYLEAYAVWENSVYSRLANINRQLIKLGFPNEAKLVRESLPCKEMKRVWRILTEYSLSVWDMSYILQDNKEFHDKKKREK